MCLNIFAVMLCFPNTEGQYFVLKRPSNFVELNGKIS